MTQQHEYDLAVIGSGPAGQRAAIQAAKLGRRVVVIEKQNVVGGVCINTGTIPSKTLREAVLHLSGHRERGVYGAAYAVKRNITMADLHFRTGHVVRHEIDVLRHQLMRNRIDVVAGAARFHDANTLFVARADGHGNEQVSAGRIVIAVGTEATRNAGIPFDGQRVLISDDVLDLAEMPRSLTVIGAGVIGIEYATMFATLGVRVTLVDKRDRLLPFIDREITDNLAYHMQHNWVTLRLGEEVRAVEPVDDGRGQRVRTTLASGKQIVTDKALYSIGRTGATGGLNLEAAGLCTDARGRLAVNANFQTCRAHIYAVGDVIGFPSLASTSMEQGRLAACHAFEVAADSTPGLFPYGIYTIPEISTVGRNEEELTAAGVPYEIGKANYKEIARGQILGDSAGLLKLIFHRETRALLGVHIIGDGASELVHIGQAVLAHGGTIDYFVDNVFNYPTLAECYKTAAFDGINRLGVSARAGRWHAEPRRARIFVTWQGGFRQDRGSRIEAGVAMDLLRRVLLPALAMLLGLVPAFALACGVSAQRSPLFQRASLVAAEGGVVGITFLGHASFLIESPGATWAVTDFSGRHAPPRVPEIVTMNHAHSTHYTDNPDPRIAHVLRGWRADGGPAQHDIKAGDMRVRNLPTNIRNWDGGTRRYGNSIFVFETAGLCIAHLGHLHHLLTPDDLATLGALDIVMVPIDGAWTSNQGDMVEVIGQLNPRIVLPMHYWNQDVLDRFLARMRDKAEIVRSDKPGFTISRATMPAAPQVLVLPGSHF